MRIAVIVSYNVPSYWAHAINTIKHAEGFCELDHEVFLLSVHRFKEMIMRFKIGNFHKFYDINSKIKIHYFYDKSIFFFRSVKYIGIIINKLEKLYPKLRKFFDPEKRIAQYCKKKKFDFAYCRSYRATEYFIQNKIPVVMESHTQRLSKLDYYLSLKLGNNDYFKGIITIHEKLKDKFVKKGIPPEKILVLEDAVDIKKFDLINKKKMELREVLKLNKDKKIVMYCGSLKPGKGISQILKVAKRFDYSTLFYILGGSKKEILHWKKIIKRKNLVNVRFLGFVNHSAVPLYLKSADVLILLYDLKETKRIMDINTTSPIKLFEYMASNTPIISSKIPSIEKIVSHNKEALLAEMNNIEEVSKHISLLLNDKHLAQEIANNAYEKAKTYTYKKRCSKIIEKFYLK